LVVIDEAYINFSRQKSWLSDLQDYPNLVVLQTLSKAWGLAGIRLGMAFASKEIIGYLNKVKPPYNISEPVQELAIKALDEIGQVNDMIVILVNERQNLVTSLLLQKEVLKIYPSDANFLLVKFKDASGLYKYFVDQGIVVRDRSNVVLCEGCLRITVGTPQENSKLLESLNSFNQ
jgi:histidinol-phosphate aminotransferase